MEPTKPDKDDVTKGGGRNTSCFMLSMTMADSSPRKYLKSRGYSGRHENDNKNPRVDRVESKTNSYIVVYCLDIACLRLR